MHIWYRKSAAEKCIARDVAKGEEEEEEEDDEKKRKKESKREPERK